MSSAKRSKRQDLPAPESPINKSLNSASATVSVVGRLTGDSSIETSDGVQINLVEPSEAAQTMMPASGCVEVVGTVRDTGSVSPLRVAAFGDDFDLKNYDDLIGLAGDKYAALFR